MYPGDLRDLRETRRRRKLWFEDASSPARPPTHSAGTGLRRRRPNVRPLTQRASGVLTGSPVPPRATSRYRRGAPETRLMAMPLWRCRASAGATRPHPQLRTAYPVAHVERPQRWLFWALRPPPMAWQLDAVAVALGAFRHAVSATKTIASAMTADVKTTRCPGIAVTSPLPVSSASTAFVYTGHGIRSARRAQRSVAAHGVALIERATTNACEGEPETWGS